MKIHLPVGLRKALLACFKSVASHNKLSHTVSTGTVLLGMASLLWSGGLRVNAASPDEDEPGISEEEDVLPAFDVIVSDEGNSDQPSGGINLCELPADDFYGDATTYSQDATEATVEGKAWYKEVASGQTYNIQAGADLKLSNGYTGGAEPSPTLKFAGVVNSLYFTADPGASKGAFHFTKDTWVMDGGASVKEIYIDNAEVFFGMDVDLESNVHVKGLTTGGSQPYEGTIRANGCTVTIGGDLIVEDDALISVQTGHIVVEGKLTGKGELVIGSYSDGSVTLKQGGTLEGQLTFPGNSLDGNHFAELRLGDDGTAGDVTLTVYGLVSKDDQGKKDDVILAQSQATLVLNGTAAEGYIFKGLIGEENAPSDIKTGWEDTSKLSLTVQLGSGAKQTLAGGGHLKDLTISGGTLATTAVLQVDGVLNATGGTLELGGGACLVLGATSGTMNFGTFNLTGDATLSLTGMLTDLVLSATNLPQDGTHKLHIALSSEFVESIKDEGTYKLFAQEGWEQFVEFDMVAGYTIGWGSDGNITITEAGAVTWNALAGTTSFTWAAEGTVDWTSGGNGVTSEGSVVTLTNNDAEGGATVTLSGAVHAGDVTFDGSHGFILETSDSGTLSVAGGLTVNTDLVCKATVNVTGTLNGTGNIQIGENYTGIGSGGGVAGSITIEGSEDVELGGWLSVTQGSFEATNAHVKLGGGLSSDQLGITSPAEVHKWGGTVNVKSLETNVEGEEVKFEGSLTVTETLTKTGAGKQILYGTNLTIGSIDVQAGILHFGGDQYASNSSHKPNLSTGNISVSGGSFEWQAGTLTVTGRINITGEGSSMSVLTGDLRLSANVNDLLVINGTGASLNVTGNLIIEHGESTMKVVGGGSLTAASLSGPANQGTSFFNHGHAAALTVGDESSSGTVTIGAKESNDALLQVKHLTVIGAGSRVTVWGNLSSSWGDQSDITGGTVEVSGGMVQQGALTIDGGTLTVGGYYASKSDDTTANGGAITLSNGGSMTVGGGLHSSGVTLSGEGSKLMLSSTTDPEEVVMSTLGNLNAGTGSTVELGAKQSLTVTGTLTMGEGVGLTLKDGTLTVGTLDASAGGASLTLTMTEVGGNLDITNLTLGENGKLKITLEGYDTWVAGHAGEVYQLFNSEHFSALWSALNPGGSKKWTDFFDIVAEGQAGLGLTLSETGALTFEKVGGFTWTTETGSTTFTWSSSGTGNGWTTGEAGTVTTEGDVVTFTNGQSDKATITVNGEVKAASAQIGGTGGGFTFTGSGTVTVAGGITITTGTTFGDGVGVTAGKLTISGENTVVEFSGAEGSVNVKGSLNTVGDPVTEVTGEGGIVLKEGATLKLKSNVFSGLAYVQGDGTVDIDMSGDQTGAWNNWFGNLFPAVEYNKSEGSGITLQLTNSTHLTLEGNLGDRMQNVKAFNITDGSSVIVTKNVGGSDLFALGEGHTLSITGTGKDGAGALQFDAAETIAWNFVLAGDATISGTAATTLTGELDTATHILTKKGTGELVLGTGFSTKEGSSGTLNVTEGTLKLNYGESAALSGHTVQLTAGSTLESSITGTVGTLTGAGTLKVTGGTLTLGTAAGSTLTSLALGSGETAGNLVVSAGSFTISGGWTWVDGSSLTLGTKGQVITLSGLSDLNGDTVADGHKLTINITKSFLEGIEGTTGVQLFASEGFNAGFEAYFNIVVTDGGDAYTDLTLDSTGKLTWGSTGPGPEPGGDTLYWGTGDADNTLTLGEGGNEWSYTQGTQGSQSWESDKNVVLESNSEGGATVQVAAGGASVKNLTLGGTASYTFMADGDEDRTVTITEGLTNNTGLTISEHVIMDVQGTYSGEGDITLNGGTLSIRISEDATISGDLVGTGGTLAVCTWSGDGDAAEQHTLTLSGTGIMTGAALQMAGAGANVELGGSYIQIGGLTQDDALQDGRSRTITKAAGVDSVYFTLQVAEGVDASADKVQFGEGIDISKDGNGKQTLSNASIAGSVSVWNGELALTSSADMPIGGGVMLFGGTLSWSGGTLTITGELTYQSGATLKLIKDESHSPKLSFAGGFGESDEAFTLTLSGFTLEDFKGDGYQLFDSAHWDSTWEEKFNLDIEGVDAQGGSIEFNDTGALVWVEPGPAGDLYWGSGSGESGELTWGGTGGGQFDSSEDGGGEKLNWTSGDNVHFSGDSEHTVSLADNITTGTFDAEGTSGDSRTTYIFKSNEDGTPRDLTVGGSMTATNADLTFEDDVNLTVEGDVTLTSSTLTLYSDMVFTGSMSGGQGSVKNGNTLQQPAMVSSYAPTAAAANTVFTLWNNGTTDSVSLTDFVGKFGYTLGENVGYGVTVGETPLSITGGGTFERNFKLAQGDLTFDGAYTFNESFTIGTDETDTVLTAATGGTQASVSHTGDLTITGGLVVKAGTEVTFKGGTGTVNAGVITLEEGAKLILQGAQTWTGTNNWNNYATGDGEVVFMGMGKQEVKIASGGGILWAFTSNNEEAGHDLGSMRLSTWAGEGEGGADAHTTLYITGEMGGPQVHGVANIANIWVDVDNSLVLGTAALGEPRSGSHQNNTLHLAGDGSHDAYDDSGNTADAALMLVGENSAYNRRIIKWNIDITANTSIGVTDAAAEVPQSGQQYWTLEGKMYNNGRAVEKKGGQKLILGAGCTTAENAEGGTGRGTWKVSAGTLELAYNATDTMSEWTVELAGGTLATTKNAKLKSLSGTGTGTLNVSGGTLTLTGGISGTLTELTLGDGAVLDVTGGESGFTIEGTWHWGTDSALKLGAAVILGSNLDITDGSTKKLTIDLSSGFLGDGATRGEKQLFTGLQAGWENYFTFLVDNAEFGAGNYENLQLDTTGKLTWGPAAQPGDILYWGGGSNDGNVMLGTASDSEWSHVQGEAGTEAWAQDKEVVLEAASGDITVTVGEGATMNSLEITAGAAYTFTAEGAKTLTVTSGMTIGANATFGENVGVTAGTATVNSGTVRFESGSSLTAAKLTISGENTVVEFSGAEGSVNVTGTLENQVAGDKVTGVTGEGGIVLKEGATLKLKGNVFSDLAYVQGDGTVDVEMGGDQTGAWDNWFGNLFPAVGYNMSTGSGVTLRLTNSTHLTLAGNLGDRMQNVKTLDVTDGSSVIVQDNAGGVSFFPTGEGHTLRIAGTGGEGDPGALQFGAAETIAWNFVLTGDATISGAAETTLTGELDAATHTLTKKGAGDLVLGEGFSTKEGSSGTLNVTEGALKLSYGTSEALSGYAVQLESGVTMESSITGAVKNLVGNGGTLNVSGGKLTLAEGISGSLTELTLGDNATLEVTGGSGFTIEGAWHWGAGSTLKLGAAVTLGGSVELTDGSVQKLTIDLSSGFLGNSKGGTKQLFTSGFKADWVDYFTFLVDSQGFSADYYEDLKLDANGMLRWGKASENLYWGSGKGETELTWGSGQFDSETNGGGTKTDWVPGSNVFFEAKDDTTHTVTLAGDITTGTFNTTGNGAKAKYTFTTGGTSPRLDVKGGMTVKNSEITFENGVILAVNNGISLTDSTMSMEGTADITGDLTGTGSTLKVDGGGHVTLHGSVAGFSGTLDTGSGGTITLSGTDTQVQTPVVGSGILEVNSATGVTLTGQLGGENDKLTVKNSGVGELLITSGDIGADTSLSFGEGAGNIVLGDAGHAVKIGGSKAVEGTGTLVLRNVTLASDFGKGRASLVVDTADPAQSAVRAVSVVEATGGVVDVGGMAAENLDGIKVNAHGLLTNVSGTYKVSPDRQLTLYFTEDNLGEEGAGLIAGNDGFTVELQGGDAAQQGLHLEFDEVEIIEELRKSGDAGTLYLRALKGGTWNAKDAGVTVDWEKEGGLMDILVSAYEFTDDGLTITGSTRDIYIVMDGEYSDSATSNDPADLAEKLATVVTKEKTLTLNWSGVGTVRNLLGEEDSHLVINASAGQGLTVTLENAYHKTIHDDRYPGDVTEAQGMDTEFGGTITGGKGVSIVKSGLGTLTVGGNYSVVGDTRIAEGALHLKGAENTLGSLTFVAGEGEKRELQLEGGKTSVGGITTSEGVTGAALKLTGGAELTLTGTSSMADAAISSEDNSGRLKLGKGASLTFTEGKGITGTAVEMEEAELDMGATQSALTSLNGSGTLKSASGGTVTVGGGEFTGTLTGTGGTLVLKDKVTFTLENATGTGMNVKLGTGASLLVDVSGKTGASGETLVLGNIELGDGSMKVDYGKNGIGPNFVQGNISSVGTGTLEFHSDGPIANGKVETGFTLGTGDWQDFLDGIKYTGVGNFVKDHVAERGENDKLVLNMTDAKENKFEREIPGAGKNAHAGAQMLWESLRELTLGDALFAVFANPTSDYARLVFALVQDIDNGQTTGLERTLTSVAGASISTLTPALAQDIHRQLTTIRNRTTGMSAEVPTDGYDEFPFWHAWIQAEGGYHKMDADGTAPGFTLHNWGGTVGVDADISRATTMGLAVTAMYGDLKPDAADSATGDLDTVYLSAFARTMRGAWSHTFVLIGGIAEAKLDRTVSYNGGSYRTRGDTDGYVVGALYEVGYTRLANKEGTVALQPIANVELRHTSLRGYTEKGSDAGVDVDDMDMTVLTLGAGARVQAAVGENAFNRSTVLEARLLAKADIGDRSGTATNAIVGHSKRAEVESAEVGAVGIETGVGISIPLGSHSGSIFADASLEWRDNWVSTSATLGYRINF